MAAKKRPKPFDHGPGDLPEDEAEGEELSLSTDSDEGTSCGNTLNSKVNIRPVVRHHLYPLQTNIILDHI